MKLTKEQLFTLRDKLYNLASWTEYSQDCIDDQIDSYDHFGEITSKLVVESVYEDLTKMRELISEIEIMLNPDQRNDSEGGPIQ